MAEKKKQISLPAQQLNQWGANFKHFATPPSQALGCYWSNKKWPSSRSECTHWDLLPAWLALLQHKGDWLQWIGFFHEHPEWLSRKISNFSSGNIFRTPCIKSHIFECNTDKDGFNCGYISAREKRESWKVCGKGRSSTKLYNYAVAKKW